ncbi:MAG: cytochrome C peroxidase [Chitinophagaceae bacterium]|nr:cytochrome C peroxidase [Chitinophagaceae bacterium]
MQVYQSFYHASIDRFKNKQDALLQLIRSSEVSDSSSKQNVQSALNAARTELKKIDFWLRYFEPIAYKQINGPLPVEWETEVFEKFEKPYKRVGRGLTLAGLYLDENEIIRDTLYSLVESGQQAMECYSADSITTELNSYHHFFLCNRLYLLNLAAIYTTGFECPNPENIIPELRTMLVAVKDIYQNFSTAYPKYSLTANYQTLYENLIAFAEKQSADFEKFDHFTFIRDFINPLFRINQQLIVEYKVKSKSMLDYSLNRASKSIFSKDLYFGQNDKGVFLRVNDSAVLKEIDRLGKMLFYDPILSGNNERSCASCHKPTEFFTDTSRATALSFDKKFDLPRNTPSLLNAPMNHLVMMDGKHISLQDQIRGVALNPEEMGSEEKNLLKKILSCAEYKNGFEKLVTYTPLDEEVSLNHISSAITFYYSKFSRNQAPFDDLMNADIPVDPEVKKGFNVFMSKAQCATCHFVPYFNGVKPPYVGSEFEVLGVPEDTAFSQLSDDKGRYLINSATETLNAFRTGSLRNIMHTAPFMHNGVFKSMEEVIDFYDKGGGVGKGLVVPNQTLSSDSLHLTEMEKNSMIAFMRSLDEKISFEDAPKKLPVSSSKSLNKRKVGGLY